MTQGGERFYGTFSFIHDPIFGKFYEELREAFHNKFPTLRNRKDVVLCMDG